LARFAKLGWFGASFNNLQGKLQLTGRCWRRLVEH
jgi:hypothetical protein